MICQYLWSTFYGLVGAIIELRRRSCSGALRVHGISTRVRVHACRFTLHVRVEIKRPDTRVTGLWYRYRVPGAGAALAQPWT